MLWQVIVPCWQIVTVTNRALSGVLPVQLGEVGPQSTTAETTLVGGLLLELEDDDEDEEEEDEDEEEEEELDCEPEPPLFAVVAGDPLLEPLPPQAARLATASPARAMTMTRIVAFARCRLW